MTDTAMTYTVGGLPPCRSFPFTTVAVAPLKVVDGCGLLLGFAARETTGAAAAVFDITDGSVVGSSIELVPVNLSANQSVRDVLPSTGLVFERGLWVTASSGTITGALWLCLLDRATLNLFASLGTPPAST